MREVVLIVISFLILISPAYACIAMPVAKLAEECSGYGTPSAYSNFDNKTSIIERLQQYKNHTLRCFTPNNQTGDELLCQGSGQYTVCRWQVMRTIDLTDGDIETIADFLSNGYSVMKQTTEEYQIFLENATKINNDISTCDYYSAVAYKGGWTGYIFNDESEKTVSCANAPRRVCGGSGTSNIIWNDLSPRSITTGILVNMLNYWWIILIIIATVIISLFYKFKK